MIVANTQVAMAIGKYASHVTTAKMAGNKGFM